MPVIRIERDVWEEIKKIREVNYSVTLRKLLANSIAFSDCHEKVKNLRKLINDGLMRLKIAVCSVTAKGIKGNLKMEAKDAYLTKKFFGMQKYGYVYYEPILKIKEDAKNE